MDIKPQIIIGTYCMEWRINYPVKFQKKQTGYYGACTSIRVWYKDGPEVEFGIVEPSWMSMPLDDGTHKVLSDGYKVVIDKKLYFKNLEL